jgi:hypothetical protein
MTTLDTTAANRVERIKDFHDFRARGMADHARAKMKRIVIDPTVDRVKAADLIEVLRLSNIEVKATTAPFTSNTAHTYMEKDSRAAARTFPAGSYVIDPDTPQDKAFVDDNMGRFRRNQMRGPGQPKEQYGFYDITAWSLPLGWNLTAHWTEENGNVQATMVDQAYLDAARRGGVSGRAAISYIIPYETDTTAALVMRLLQNGYKVNVATRQLNAGGRNWRPGTFVVRISRNPETIHDAIAQYARHLGVNVVAVNSGYSEEGDTSGGGEAGGVCVELGSVWGRAGAAEARVTASGADFAVCDREVHG